MRGPSFYNYFPSLHAVYDALFARGLHAQNAAIEDATAGCEPGVEWLSAMARSIVRWSVENPGLAALQYWRPIPGFEPSAETFAASKDRHERVRAQFAAAARSGQLSRRATSDEAIGLFTVVIAGLFTQQAANEPGVPYESGRFTALMEEALDMFFHRYRRQGRQ